MSTYRYVTSNILTGAIQHDSLPIVGQTCARHVNSVGNFTGYLPLVTAGQSATMTQTWVNAVTPWRSILWVLQDGAPIWGGPVTGWPHQSITDGTLPIQAASIENMFKYRQIAAALTYNNIDVFDIFYNLLQYALSKTPNGQIAGTGKYAGRSGITDTFLHSGILGSISETAGFQSIYDAFNDLVTSFGLEYTFAPVLTDSLSLSWQVQLGIPQMGRLYEKTGLQLRIPAQGAVDYAWQWVPSTPANRMVVSGTGGANNAKTYTGIATASKELAQGFPLLEGNSSFFGTVGSQQAINQYAQFLLYQTAVLKGLTPLYSIAGDGFPRVRDIQLGDEAMIVATSPLHPGQGPQQLPGISQLMRITGWTLTFPQAQIAEETQYQLGGTVIGQL